MLLSDRLHNLLRVVRVIRVPRHMRRRIVVNRVLMPAQNADRVPADPHPRPRNQPRIDRPHHRRVRRPRTLRPHIALRREPRHQIRFSGQLRQIVRSGTLSTTVCKSSAPGCRNKCTCASISPGISVMSPRSITSAPAGCSTDVPAAAIRSPSTSTSPGVTIFPAETSNKRAACSTIACPCASRRHRRLLRKPAANNHKPEPPQPPIRISSLRTVPKP